MNSIKYYKEMNKQEFVNAIASESGLSKADSEKALNATTEAIKNALAKGESVQLIGFGTFSISERAARTGRNPQTGKEIQIAAKKVAKFKPGKALDETIN
ncbi:HU family DNA-binding protein [Plebeiibacterium marinum]|uniref:HU family DNA-binding protein n=1 Tax=Plebeiibacterium marinum TaxID=2992111 RepID=UPI003F4DA62D